MSCVCVWRWGGCAELLEAKFFCSFAEQEALGLSWAPGCCVSEQARTCVLGDCVTRSGLHCVVMCSVSWSLEWRPGASSGASGSSSATPCLELEVLAGCRVHARVHAAESRLSAPSPCPLGGHLPCPYVGMLSPASRVQTCSSLEARAVSSHVGLVSSWEALLAFSAV